MIESKVEKVTRLKAYLKKSQRFYEVLWDVDFISTPTTQSIKKELEERADRILAYSENHTNSIVKYATMLKDKQIRFNRAKILMTRWQKVEQRRKSDVEEIARIADEFGHDGSIFRELFQVDDPVSIKEAKRLEKKIETILKIIAAIERPTDKSAITENAELVSIPQLSRILQIGQSEIRRKNNKGDIPASLPISKNLLWSRKKITDWINAGCPNRQQWEVKKQRKGA